MPLANLCSYAYVIMTKKGALDGPGSNETFVLGRNKFHWQQLPGVILWSVCYCSSSLASSYLYDRSSGALALHALVSSSSTLPLLEPCALIGSQWHVQDLKEGGASLSHTPQNVDHALVNAFLFLKIAGWQRRLFGPSCDEKELFRERILEANKFIVGTGYQSSILILSVKTVATELPI